MTLETIGWIGSVLLAICGAKEAYLAWKTKDCHISWYMLITWGLGEVLTLIPVILHIKSPFLIFNYLINSFFIGMMIYYKAKAKKL